MDAVTRWRPDLSLRIITGSLTEEILAYISQWLLPIKNLSNDHVARTLARLARTGRGHRMVVRLWMRSLVLSSIWAPRAIFEWFSGVKESIPLECVQWSYDVSDRGVLAHWARPIGERRVGAGREMGVQHLVMCPILDSKFSVDSTTTFPLLAPGDPDGVVTLDGDAHLQFQILTCLEIMCLGIQLEVIPKPWESISYVLIGGRSAGVDQALLA